MKIEMQQAEKFDGLSYSSWDIAFIGESIDDRGAAAIDFVSKNSKEVFTIKYIAEDLQISVNGNLYDVDNYQEALEFVKDKKVIIESTTLGFVEILLASQCAKNFNLKNLSFLYIEPLQYKKKQKNLFLHRREFDLSGQVVGYRPVPGYMQLVSSDIVQKVVFFPGFEAARMDRAFEDNPLINSRFCFLIFGVPAFKSGWEMNAFANNIDVIKERKISGGVQFCGATDPLAAYDLLHEIHAGLQSEETMQIAPIGTKPAGIGTILFLVTTPGTGLLYDHPQKEDKRTDKISSWHLFNVNFENE